MLVIGAWQGAATDAAPGSQRFMRVVTFNLWGGNDRIDDVAKFLAAAEADAVVLQEVTREHGTMLRQALQSLYPFSLGESSIVILSKHPILAEGRIDRPGFPSWNSLMLRWARIDVNGTGMELAGVHLARPFYPTLQEEDRGADELRADPQRTACRRRRFQREPVDREARPLHPRDASRALQHIASHLADAARQASASSLRRHRQCLRLASFCQDRDERRPATWLRSQGGHRRYGARRA